MIFSSGIGYLKGNIIKKFGSYSTREFTNIGGICINNKGEILVADSFRVQSFNQDWQFLSSFRLLQHKSIANQTCFPQAILVDQDDNIFVSNAIGRRITIFSASGHPVCQIPTKYDAHDMLLCRKKLFVCCTDSVYVFGNIEE